MFDRTLCVRSGNWGNPNKRIGIPKGYSDALLATMVKARKEREIPALFSGSHLSYNEGETGLTVPCLSCHARLCKLSADPLIAAFDLRRLKHRSISVYSCNKAS